ncbi:hypothetical protein ACOSP7_013911 [Xanthoceras sorbifolium]
MWNGTSLMLFNQKPGYDTTQTKIIFTTILYKHTTLTGHNCVITLRSFMRRVKTVIEKPHNDHLPLIEASRLCNMDIISHVQQVICFAFHDSRLLMETCQEAKNLRKIVTLFYLD